MTLFNAITQFIFPKKNAGNEQPFIIWTHRRTGGTNFAQQLFDTSSFNAIQHEPFNLDRKLGYIHKQWCEKQNVRQLQKNLKQALQNKPLIKHCVEITPNEFNLLLLKVATKLGYQHIFLYREFPKDRLLSLNFAIQTGIWGSKKDKSFDSSVFSTPIDIVKLTKHEKHCRNQLITVFNAIKDEAHTHCISFEALYDSKNDEILNTLQRLLNNIGIKYSSVDDFYNQVKGSGNLGKKSIYQNYINFDEFSREMEQFSRLKLTK